LASIVLLWSKTPRGDWDDWLTHTGVEKVKPASQVQFDHEHFVLQAAMA
jgi:LysR family glycine cleavage system transcriptional activator